jgi:diacylglycerol kinase family enzyme/membrane-associated phospholipid phosphatase
MTDPQRSSPVPSQGFLRARFARDHYLGLPLTTGVLAVASTLLLFALIAYEVATHGALTRLDRQLADWFNRRAFSPLTELVLGYTDLHGTIGVLAMGALLLWHMLRHRQWLWAADLLLVLPGGMLFNFGLKHVFTRLRPSFADPILVLHSYSFPSGHTIGATLLYATLAAYLLNQPALAAGIAARLGTGARGAAAAAIGGALLLVALTAFSRVYLGAHFLSDVLGAMLLGMAWFAFWTTLLFISRRHYSAAARSNCPMPITKNRTEELQESKPQAMPPAARPDAVAVINAKAGGGHAQELAERIAHEFAGHGLRAEVRLARSGEDMLAIARRAVRDKIGIVAVGGGDGSVNAVASTLIADARCESALGVLPLGTLNHFAKDLGIPLALEQAIANIAHGRRIRVDSGEVNGVPFINNSSLGLYPDIVREREKQQARLGRGKWLAFSWAAMGALRRYPFLRVRLRIGDQDHWRRTPFVFIGNNEYLMSGLDIGKRSTLMDGQLSLYVCHRTGRLGLLRLAVNALFGRLREAHDFDALTAGEILVETHRKRMRVATDGEVTIMQTPLRYRIRPASLQVIVPPAAVQEEAPTVLAKLLADD